MAVHLLLFTSVLVAGAAVRKLTLLPSLHIAHHICARSLLVEHRDALAGEELGGVLNDDLNSCSSVKVHVMSALARAAATSAKPPVAKDVLSSSAMPPLKRDQSTRMMP